MKFFGDANLQQNELQRAVLPLYTTFPVGPKVGEVAFVNQIVYICVDLTNDLPVWVPLTREITQYTHSQNSAAATWNVVHNLNTGNVQVQVFDADDKMIIPQEITIADAGNVTIDFGQATAGRAVLVSGHFDGNTKPTYAYTHYELSASDTWVINHGLGREPIVRVFIGNQEVQPASITFNTSNQLTITFNMSYSGVARLI